MSPCFTRFLNPTPAVWRLQDSRFIFFQIFFSSCTGSICTDGVILPFLLGQVTSTLFVDLKVAKSLVFEVKIEETLGSFMWLCQGL